MKTRRKRPAGREPGIDSPLSLCEVLEAEHEALHGPLPADRPGWSVTREDLRDLSRLAARLRDPDDAVARAVAAGFGPGTRELLAADGGVGSVAEGLLRVALADELDRLLDAPDLARREGIRQAPLPRDLLLLARETLSGEELRRFNRLLLEALFPDELASAEERRLAALGRAAHGLPRPRSALCLSGGGVRSAAFSLGVVQGLARQGLLGTFDYLSTVSGGGYLGGLLTAWAHRHPRGLAGVERALAGEGAPRLDPDPTPVRHLRAYASFLSPRLGLLSADAWTLIAIYARNLFIYWLVALPLLAAALMVPRLYVPLLGAPSWFPHWFEGGSGPVVTQGAFALGSLLMIVAIAYIGIQRPSAGGRPGSQGRFLIWCLVPLVGSAVALSTFWAWARAFDRDYPAWLFVVLAAGLNVVGWLAHAVMASRRGRRPLRLTLYELAAAVAAGSLGGSLTWVAAHRLFPQPLAPLPLEPLPLAGLVREPLPLYLCFAVPTVLLIFFVSETLFTGLVSTWTNDEDREWWARTGAWVLIAVFGWSAVAALVVYGPALLLELPTVLAPLGGLSGAVTLLLAHSAKTPERREKVRRGDLTAIATSWALSLAAPVFAVCLVAAVSLGTSWLLLRLPASSGGPLAAFASLRGLLPVPLLAAQGSFGIGALDHLATVFATPLGTVAALCVAMLAFGLASGLLMNINKFSLHASYRNRIIRSFLGASRERRNPNPFTGFDPDDNVELHRLRGPLHLTRERIADPAALCARLANADEPLAAHLAAGLAPTTRAGLARLSEATPPESLVAAVLDDLDRRLSDGPLWERERFRGVALSPDTRLLLARRRRRREEETLLNRLLLEDVWPEVFDRGGVARPLLVVNMALNLVGGGNLAWQRRKAESFTASPLHCGSLRVGYRPSRRYGGSETVRPITLGTAMAISGATASPNMGYYSSPAITFLLTLFNARLGWWLGNPGAAGRRTFELSHPKLAPRPLIAEALGLTNDVNPYIYLSDGGHFENLGLYEMVLRRCRVIVAIDAGEDGEFTFADLGEAIRKIRIDLGIPIELPALPIGGGRNAADGRYCAVGTVRYSCVDGDDTDGVLVYLKPAVYGGEPADVLHYRNANPRFPHEPTADQWFDEAQLESYRMLGSHVVDSIAGRQEPVCDLAGFVERAAAHVAQEPPEWLRPAKPLERAAG